MADDVSELYFGLDPVPALGILQSASENKSAEVAEARGEDGKIIEMKAYSVTEERQYEAMVKKGAAQPTVGTVITDGAWKGLLTSVQRTRSNSEYDKYSITAQCKDAAKLIPYAATPAGGSGE